MRAGILRGIYSLVIAVLFPLAVLRLVWLGIRKPSYLNRISERFGYVPFSRSSRPVILIHAVSVGEVNAISPLLLEIRRKFPDRTVVVTTVTATGEEALRRIDVDHVVHAFFPYDLGCFVDRFLDRICPELVVVVETEIWPNFFLRCQRRRIPLAIVNARISPGSFSGYARVSGLFADTIRRVSVIATQSETHSDRFLKLGASPAQITNCGNLKFDIQIPSSVFEKGQAARRKFAGRQPIWVAASTHEGEEGIILDVYREIRLRIAECLLVLVPRHPDRAQAIAALVRRAGLTLARRTEAGPGVGTFDVFLVDTIGELPVYYAAADVAFVGGSLVQVGGHNMLEPASLGVPIVTGPSLFNFADIVEMLQSGSGIDVCGDREKLLQVVYDYLSDANLRYQKGQCAKAVFERNQGATSRIMSILERLIEETVEAS